MTQLEARRIEGRYKTEIEAASCFEVGLVENGWSYMLAAQQPVTSFYISYFGSDPFVHHWNRGTRARAYTTPPNDLRSVNGNLYRFEKKTAAGKSTLERPLSATLTFMDDAELKGHLAPFLNGHTPQLRMALASLREYLLPKYCFSDGQKLFDYPRVTIDKGYKVVLYGDDYMIAREIPFLWVKVEVKYLEDDELSVQLPIQLLQELGAVAITADDIKEEIERVTNATQLICLQEV